MNRCFSLHCTHVRPSIFNKNQSLRVLSMSLGTLVIDILVRSSGAWPSNWRLWLLWNEYLSIRLRRFCTFRWILTPIFLLWQYIWKICLHCHHYFGIFTIWSFFLTFPPLSGFTNLSILLNAVVSKVTLLKMFIFIVIYWLVVSGSVRFSHDLPNVILV
jgi:hypothetical protein